MKKLCLILILSFVLAVAANPPRPSNHWLIRYDDDREFLIEAQGHAHAVELFRKAHSTAEIHSASRISFVYSEWIWKPKQ